MRLTIRTMTLLIPLGLGLACANTPDSQSMAHKPSEVESPEWVRSNTTAKPDDYRQSIALRGPDVQRRIGKQGAYYRAHIRGMTAKNGARQFQIYVATHLKGQWHNLHKAQDQDGIAFAVSKVTRKKKCVEGDCGYYEHVAIPIPADYLPVRTRADIDLYLSGPGGDVTVTIPATYVRGFLARVEAEESAMLASSQTQKRAANVSYCEAKFAGDDRAMSFCQKEARASYQRLKPSIASARQDAFTRTAKVLDTCMRRHNGQLGVDWMMVEHCYSRAIGQSAAGPAAR
jgi:hypothetical protein